jgi:hypothetical protein
MGFKVKVAASIGAGTSFRWDGWSWPGAPDMGPQYFSAHPSGPQVLSLSQPGMLITSEQSKTLELDVGDFESHYSYGFRITNPGPQDLLFDVEGGGYT